MNLIVCMWHVCVYVINGDVVRRYMQIRYHFIGDLDTIVVDKAPAVPNFRLSALYGRPLYGWHTLV